MNSATAAHLSAADMSEQNARRCEILRRRYAAMGATAVAERMAARSEEQAGEARVDRTNATRAEAL